MRPSAPEDSDRVIVERADFQRVFDALAAAGYTVVGPTARDEAIVCDRLTSVDDLPAGLTDEQDAAAYRLKPREDAALFGFVVGPQSWKKYFSPPVRRLWRAVKEEGGFRVEADADPPERLALLGARSCELHAIAIQDKVFMEGPWFDPAYRARREAAFVVAVHCGQAGGTCFCVSMDTGPRATRGFDLAFTEVVEPGRHHFVFETGTERGAQVLAAVPHRPAAAAEVDAADKLVAGAAERMGRRIDTTDLPQVLTADYRHPRWEHVAARCLTCANCTLVCPTCFCSTVEDVTDLSGAVAERRRRWDSCFNLEFSYIHGGSVRTTPRSRYRQWLTHKLATWHGQFGTSGCVGCGRCITWCPAGIDLTEEVRAIRDGAAAPGRPGEDPDDGNA